MPPEESRYADDWFRIAEKDLVRVARAPEDGDPELAGLTTAEDFIIMSFRYKLVFAYMKLSEWARRNGISYITAWRWFKAGVLPAPARQLPTGTILVDEPRQEGHTVLYARVSSADQKGDLERQVQYLQAWARAQGWEEFDVVTEIGSGLNGRRKKLLRVCAIPEWAGSWKDTATVSRDSGSICSRPHARLLESASPWWKRAR